MENQELNATVAQPESAAGELAALKELAGGNSTLTVILAIIAVVGGGAGWKFWQQRAKLKHEQEMKKLEIEAQTAKSKAKANKFKEKIKKVKKLKS